MSATIGLLILLASGHKSGGQCDAITRQTKQNISVDNRFSADLFKMPSLQYGPFTRWWWPGNDVDTSELKREIRLFAEIGFAGVEIQPLTVGINPESTRRDLVNSWDTPDFYLHIITVMKEAYKQGITVDINAGSGWPIGGSFLQQSESLLTLAMADTIVMGNRQIIMDVPPSTYDYSGRIRNGIHSYNKVDLANAHLLTVTATKIIGETDGKILLDSSSTTILDPYIEKNVIHWYVPEGNQWIIMAHYAVPDGEKPAYVASGGTNWVANYFDTAVLEKTFERLFGKWTGLTPYYSKPFRAIFSDSKEFIADRLISDNFIDYFKTKQGYDIRPWLAVNTIPGYDNVYSFGRDSVSRYRFTNEDWRLRYDYDQTISDLYKERFSETSRNWAEKRGLQHRTQEYGIKVDIIGASGRASIPETEQLFGKGSEAILKLVTSGAHLYNRPIVTAEAFVFSRFAGAVTPQVIKAYANKAFAAGVNQLIYHGTPYRYQTGEYGEESWTAWSTPFKNFNYSANFSESYNYWKYMKEVNTFLARSQYVLQIGNPVTDVLVYFPFINLDNSGIVHNPDESCINGQLSVAGATNIRNPTVIQQWFIDMWPVINELEKKGITWDFINDESLMTAMVTDGNIHIRGNVYKALIIPHVPYMAIGSAEHIVRLAADNANVLVVGEIPSKQPGYLNYAVRDTEVKQFFKTALTNRRILQVPSFREVRRWAEGMQGVITFNDEYDFTRQIQRETIDGSRLSFIWNKTDEVKEIELTVDKSFPNCYWLNPEDGNIIKSSKNVMTYEMQPLSAIVAFASRNAQLPNDLTESNKKLVMYTTTEIKGWNITIGDKRIVSDSLFDWRGHDILKYTADTGIYSTEFEYNKNIGSTYFIDLGKVYHTAEIYLNEKKVGICLWLPFRLDISDFLKNGRNSIRIVVTPAERNRYLGEMVQENPKYTQYKGQENTIMPAGLVGPVVIQEFYDFSIQ
jgi:Glycosyl hydrolases family 2, sugar binding domain.